MKKIFRLSLFAAMALSASAQAQQQQQTAAQGATVPGDAYWPGAASTSVPAVPNSQSATVPGDAYWSGGATVGPSVSPNAVWADSPDQVSSESVFSKSEKGEADIPMMRANVIQEAAASFGAQAGMAARTRELNGAAHGKSFDYDRAFRFSDLMIEPGFLAPVVTEGRDAYVQPNSREVRVADRIYRISMR